MRIDSGESLERLLDVLRTHGRVPVYEAGKLCRVITDLDILDMCGYAANPGVLEQTKLQDLILKLPSMLSKVEFPEDLSMLEVLHTMREAEVRVAPILEIMGNSTEANNSISRGLVGQFDIAAFRMLFARSSADGSSDQWWWEDGTVTSNILLGPCMDFMAMVSNLVISSSVSVPYASVSSEEPLSKVIYRSLASAAHCVVIVPHGTNTGKEDQQSTSVEGIVSTLGLVLAMLEVGVFKTLRFDPSRMRIEKRGNTASQQLQPARAPPWAEAQIETRAAVTFSSCIELEHLIIPICLDHGSRNMKYVSQVDPRSEIDFHALRNLSSDSHEFGATGASAHCRLCNKSLGNVSLRQGSTPSAGSKLGFGLFDLGGLSPGTLTTLLRDGALPTFMTRPKQDQGTPKSSGVLRSALKGGGAGRKKAKTLDRSNVVRATKHGDEQVSRSFLGMCCASPCQLAGLRDHISMGSTASGHRYEGAHEKSGRGDSMKHTEAEPISPKSQRSGTSKAHATNKRTG